MGLSKVALVGMSCQASVTGSMEARRVNKWRKKIAWTFGLLCSKTFTYDGLMVEIAQSELGLDLDHLARVNVKGKLLFYTDDGDEHTYSLKHAHRFTRPGCLRCPDFAAEHADISFGGLGQSDGWTLTIVRTDRGADIWQRALADGVIEARPAIGGPQGGRADVQARRQVPGTLAVGRRTALRRRHAGPRRPTPPSPFEPSPTPPCVEGFADSISRPIIPSGPRRGVLIDAPEPGRGASGGRTRRERRESHGPALRHGAILEAVAFAAERLLLTPDWRDAADEVLARIGRRRRRLARLRHREPLRRRRRLLGSMRHEWCAPGIESQYGQPVPATPRRGDDLPRWAAIARRRGADRLAHRRPPGRRATGVRSPGHPLDRRASGLRRGLSGGARSGSTTARRQRAGARRARCAARHRDVARRRDHPSAGRANSGGGPNDRGGTSIELIPAVTYSDDSWPDGDVRMGFVSPQIEQVLGYQPERFLEDAGFWFSLIAPRGPGAAGGRGRVRAPKTPSRSTRSTGCGQPTATYRWIHDTLDGDLPRRRRASTTSSGS